MIWLQPARAQPLRHTFVPAGYQRLVPDATRCELASAKQAGRLSVHRQREDSIWRVAEVWIGLNPPGRHLFRPDWFLTSTRCIAQPATCGNLKNPHFIPTDMATSHSTKLSKNDSQVAGYAALQKIFLAYI